MRNSPSDVRSLSKRNPEGSGDDSWTTRVDAYTRKDPERRESRLRDSNNDSERSEALADLRRLTTVILDNLEEGSRNRLMDPKEMRMLGGTAIRSIRLYLKTLEEDRTRRSKEKADSSAQESLGSLREDQTTTGKD